MPRALSVAILLLTLAAGACSSSNTGPNAAVQQQVQSLQATVAALQARTPAVQTVIVTVTPSPTPSPTATPAPKTVTLSGVITAIECTGGYQLENANVTVTDEAGHIIGAGRTGRCEQFRMDFGGGLTYPWFRAPFQVTVTQANFYHLKVGTHDGPTYSLAELEQLGWQVVLSL